MNDLLTAAKAVIDGWDNYGGTTQAKIQLLRAAVERAEKQESDFYEWFGALPNPPFVQTSDAHFIWTAAQQAERERCREIVITMGGPDVPELLRQIDSGEE